MSDSCIRCGNEAGRSSVEFGKRLFCSPHCFGGWEAGRDIESLSRIDALEAANDANLAVAKEAQRLLDLRERQLADCTRAMREVSAALRTNANGIRMTAALNRYTLVMHYANSLAVLARKLDAARAGKAGA